jgi:hypothetical protein
MSQTYQLIDFEILGNRVYILMRFHMQYFQITVLTYWFLLEQRFYLVNDVFKEKKKINGKQN